MSDDTADKLEIRISELRAEMRVAVRGGDRVAVATLRAELHRLQAEWEEAVMSSVENDASVPVDVATSREALLPARDLVHQALTVLTVPAAPRLVVAVCEAFFAGGITGARLTSLRRDEERSFRTSPHARPYYVCSALSVERLTAVRGLLAISTWPMDRRMIGPLSSRVDFLVSATRIAEQVDRLSDSASAARELLWRFASNVPGGVREAGVVDAGQVIAAATAELNVHRGVDDRSRHRAARRARSELSDAEQLFGAAQPRPE